MAPEAASNEGLQQTKGRSPRTRPFAAEARCSTDWFRPVTLVNWLVGSKKERPDGARRC